MKLLTAPGMSGVAVLRAERAQREAVLGCLRAARGTAVVPVPGGPPLRATLCLQGEQVDDVLVVARMDGSLEVHTHGSPAVLDALDARFGVEVSQPRGPAERLLREAMSPAQLALAAEQLAFDFDAELGALRRLQPGLRSALKSAALARSRFAMALTCPQRLVFVGRQNAGKSTLFNLLLFRERALTGDTPGLTRDPIAELTTLAGYPYELVDTAGEGAAPTSLDAAAIDRGRAARAGSLELGVVDGAAGASAADAALFAGCALVVSTKRDLEAGPWPSVLRRDASFSSSQRPEEVRERLGALLAAARELPQASAVGGFAALDPDQLKALNDVDVDGPAAAQ